MKDDFVSTIKNTKAEDFGDKVTNIIKKEIENPENGWDINIITSAYKEVGLIANWIESTVMCAEITNQMEPMKKEIRDLNAKKESTEEEEEKEMEREIEKETETEKEGDKEKEMEKEKNIIGMVTQNLKVNI